MLQNRQIHAVSPDQCDGLSGSFQSVKGQTEENGPICNPMIIVWCDFYRGWIRKTKNMGTSHNHHISEDVWGCVLLLPTEALKV